MYIDVLTNEVKPWMDGVAATRARRPYIWQQDGSPAHTLKKTQDWCRENLSFFWEKEFSASQLTGLQSDGLFYVGRG
jgi:hypothetical protein